MQMVHTHTPYQSWCESCVCFKARANRQLRDDSSRASETPTVSFDLAFTRSIPEGANPQDVSALPFLVMVDSASGYVGCVPLRSKGQLELMTREVLSFTAGLGHAEVIFRCDNEPTMRQLLKYVVSTRLSMGLATRSVTPPAYSHGNSLVENVIGRLRPLASILMHSVRKRTGIDFSTNHAPWTWAHRHAAWLMNRYGVVRNVTPFELVHKKHYTGSIAQFAEPVFGYFRVGAKGTAKWRRALFLGKVDGQDSFLLYSGSHLVLTRSIRRIDTDWKGHLAFYSAFKCNSWEYKSGFGGRVVPTKIKREALSVGFHPPRGEIEPSAFHDADAEAVREKAREELREESERVEMGAHDDRHELPAVEDDAPPEVSFGDADAVQHDDETVEVGDDVGTDTGGVPAPSLGVAGSEAPVTPIFDDEGTMEVAYVPQTPRASPTTRAHGDEDVDIEEHQAKRARGDDPKRSRLQRITQEYASRISTVEFGNEKFHTMDNYENDQDMEQQDDSADLWADEDSLHFKDVPEDLWSDYNMERQPDEPPEWVDMLANEVEISRLLEMEVLIKEELFQNEVRDSLTTKFVHDWRAKDYTLDDGSVTKRWLRRSRLVAREYAFMERRDDCFSPATSTHVMNLLPMVYLQRCAERRGCENHAAEHVLATVDIKDAFLCVPQAKPFAVTLAGRKYIIAKNLPGQRLGAKAWYWFFRDFLSKVFGYEWCTEQPCLCRNEHSALMLHVDDVLFVGKRKFWEEQFLPKLKEQFSVSASVLEDEGSSISFLKRKLVTVDRGFALVPGTNIDKLVENFESYFGQVRVQHVACDASIQLPDVSSNLTSRDAYAYRSAVRGLLYLARDRQLASKQGVGKVRHLDGKILWIQQHVLSGDVFLQQLPTAWNVADLCTKALPQQRVKVLLHELGVCRDNGLTIIGQHEHDEQVEKHGSRRQIMQLAKSLMRVATVMGLGSSGANGQFLPNELEGSTCDIGSLRDQCDVAVAATTTAMMVESNMVNYVCIFLGLTTWVIFGCAGYWLYRKWKHGMTVMEQEQYHLGVQVAELDTAYADYSGRLISAEFGLGETARDLEFLQDYASSIHYGLVEVGGFRRYNELTSEQNRHMYATERANLTSFHVMGGDRYMRVVNQHSTGIHAAVDTTDQGEQEQGEESEMEVDEAIDVHTREHVVNRLRNLLNECLALHEHSDAAAVQQLVLMALDREEHQELL